jgi:hypothetical protein
MKLTFDKNLFMQVGLDSGSLTMLGGVTHRFMESGQYRGVAYRGKETLGNFYINVDKNSPVAQANIDLAIFEKNPTTAAGTSASGTSCGCEEGVTGETRFELNPKGYAVFHVSRGAGGYSVRVAKAAEDPKEQNQFDNRELKREDIFSAVIIRPGTYSVTNTLAKGNGEVTVSYPKAGKTPYRPPSPISVECSASGFEPAKVEVQPGQAVLFHCKVPSRIKLELRKADDGPTRSTEQGRPGWKKAALPEKKAVLPEKKTKG